MVIGLVISTTGCVNTKLGDKLDRKALFGKLEFDEAEVSRAEIDPLTGRTNAFETWRISGLKSDTQRALQTIEKALDTAKALKP